MQKLPRTAWEILTLALVAAVGYGLWTWSDFRWQRQMAEVETRLGSEIAAERETTAGVLRQRGASEAEVAARAFAAGIRVPVLKARHESVDAAVGALLRLPGVTFVHVLGREGTVIATSDRKLVTTGRAGPRASWALMATEVAIRAGAAPESTEVAVPISDGARSAVVWLGYEIGATETGLAQSGAAQSGAAQSGAVESGAAESGAGLPPIGAEPVPEAESLGDDGGPAGSGAAQDGQP